MDSQSQEDAAEIAALQEENARRDECGKKIDAILQEYGYVMEPSITLVVTSVGITRAGAAIEIRRPRLVVDQVVEQEVKT
jgi:hypothetical protein